MKPKITWFIPLALLSLGVLIVLGILENEFGFLPK